MLNPNFVIVGVLLQIIGSWSYLRDTIKGKIQPNKVTWFLWALAPLIAFAAEVKQGVGILALTTFIVGFIPLVIFIASFVNKKSEWKITKLDIFCGTVSLGGILLWSITKVGNIAIFFSILADGLAATPTIIKSYRYPETENATIYLFAIINAAIGILAVQKWAFEQYGYPVYLLLVDLILFLLIRFKLGRTASKISN